MGIVIDPLSNYVIGTLTSIILYIPEMNGHLWSKLRIRGFGKIVQDHATRKG